MPKEEKKKKIIGLRTFADDVKRARGESVDEHATASAPKEKNLATEVAQELQDNGIEVPETSPPTPPTPPTPKPKKAESTKTEKNTSTSTPQKKAAVPIAVKKAETPMDVPPFHHLRASSPNATTFTDAKEAHESAKENKQKKKQEQKHIEPETLGIDTSNIAEVSESMLASTNGVSFDTEAAEANVGEGTIVTDRKRDKFKLVPAVGEAVSDWIEDKVDDVEAAHGPKHEIIKASRRKKIIEAAAEDSKFAPSDDYASVTERLKGVERITENEEMQIKDAKDVPAPTWSHTDKADAEEKNTETQDTDAKHAAPEQKKENSVTPTSAQYVSQKSPDIAEKVPEMGDHEPRVSENAPETPPVPKKTPIVSQEAQTSPTNEVAPEADSTHGFTAAAAQSTPPAHATTPASPEDLSGTPDVTDAPVFSRAPVPAYRLNRAGQPIPQTTTGTPYLTFAAVMIVAAVLGIATTAWWFTSSDDTEVAAVEDATPALFNAQAKTTVPLSTNRTDFYQTLSSTAAGLDAEVVELETIVGAEDATLEQIFTTLGLSAPGNFIRNVSQISFGFSKEREPFIVLRTISFDVAFGGILSWEPNMSRDLSPLFGEAGGTNSYDSKIANRDIRILTSDGFNDKIVYGFINKNTILITTTRDVFAEISPVIIQ